MNKLLIVEDNQIQLEMVVVALKKYASKFEVITATNGEEAIKVLEKQVISVLVTDLYMPKLCGLDLLSYMSRNLPKVPCIVMTGFGSPEANEILDQHSLYHYLAKPFKMETLAKVVLDAIVQYEQRDKMDGLSLSGFLQLLNIEQKSCLLEVCSPGSPDGRIYVVQGVVADAECCGVNAEKAVIAMLCIDNVTLRMKSLPDEDAKQRIGLSLQSLIAEGARMKANGECPDCMAPEISPAEKDDEMFQQAVRLAEGNDLKKAQQILAKLLNNNPKNAMWWLWYSRVSDSMKIIIAALKNAALIAPEHPAIQEDVKKLEVARKSGCGDTSKVVHCPFCWMPIGAKTTVCPYSKFHLQINKYPAKIRINKDSAVLKRAVRRYKKIVLVKKSARDNYNLCLAFLNLGRWDDSLELLSKAKKIEPDNLFYKEQLKILLTQMAHLDSSEVDKQTKSSSKPSAKGTKKKGVQKTILVAEDSATTRKVISVTLSQEGFEVIEAKDGIEAMSRLNESIPDLLLLDIIMPGMDGYQVLTTMKQNKFFKDIPVIMLTAKASLLDKLKGKMSSSDEYLTKPFSPEDLVAKIKKHIK